MKILEITNNDANIHLVVQTMAEAFSSDPLYHYFIEEEVTRVKFLKQFMKFRLMYGLKHGKVFVSEDYKSVAIWISPNHKMSPVGLLVCGGLKGLLSCSSTERKRIMEFNSFADKILAQNIKQPYWLLSPICVAPSCQGRGYGKELIVHGLNFIDQIQYPCVLETQSDKNKSIYEKYGFQVLCCTNHPGSGTNHYLMIK